MVSAIFYSGVIATSSSASAPVELPGMLQAEDFNAGAAGVAYADARPGNSGGQYRSTDVDVEATADVGGGYNVGWAVPGEWLKYNVSVAAAGAYTLEFRVAAAGTGGTFHLEVNGVNVTGPLSIPNTRGWQTWTTVTKTGVNLAAGAQVWTLVFDAVGAPGIVGNVNYVRVVAPGAAGSTPFGGTPLALPGTLQAENFDNGPEGTAYHDLSPTNDGGHYRSTGVDIEATTDAGGGYHIAYVRAGEWLTYRVNVGSAGTYDVDVRVASPAAGATFHIEVNGVDRTGPFTVPATGGFQRWTTIRKTGLRLSAGQQAWRLVFDVNGASGGVGNVNFIRVQSSGGTPPPAGNRDIALYASDVTATVGNWARVGAAGAAGGELMQSNDLGWSAPNRPLAAPPDYFEARFVPEANRAYRVWLRLRGTGNSKFNESVWVQFSGAVNAGGAPLWRIGTTAGLLVNLEACAGCGISGWGWQNRAYWLADDPVVRFPAAVSQTIRIQTREDGVSIDQIVLSPVTYFSAAPGSALNDATIVPKAGTAPPRNQPPTSAITSPASGATYRAPASIAITASATDDKSVARVDFYAGTQLAGSDASAPYTLTWSNVAPGTYALTAVAFDGDGASRTSAAVSVGVDLLTTPPSRVVFTPSPDHATGVTAYSVALHRASDPSTATPVATKNLGKPTPVKNEISADISDIVKPLRAGSYSAVVTAIGPAGTSKSSASPAFTR